MSEKTEKPSDEKMTPGMMQKFVIMLRKALGFDDVAGLISSNAPKADAALAGEDTGSPMPDAIPPEALQQVTQQLRNRPQAVDAQVPVR